MKKKINSCFLKVITLAVIFVCFILSCLPVDAQTINEAKKETEYKAQAIYLYSYSADRVLYSKCDEQYLAPASTAKMMAGLLVCERHYEKLDQSVTITEEMITHVEGTTMGLKSGTTLTVRDLLYGTICGGNNDAAQALSIVCSGSVASFVAEMNSYANLLDMRNTKYINPTGLDNKEAKTTLFDTAKLAAKAASNPLYLSISSTPSYNINDSLKVYNRNALISQFSAQGYINKNAQGLIAGYTDNGGYVLATYATKNEESFLCVVMGAEGNSENIYSYYIANKLLNQAFNNYEWLTVGKTGDIVDNLSVGLAITNKNGAKIPCALENDVSFFLPKNTKLSDIEYKIYYHIDNNVAPIEKNDILGGIDFYYDGTFLGSTRLVANSSVKANSILLFLENIKAFLLCKELLLTILFSATAIFFYLRVIRKGTKRKIISVGKHNKSH